MSKVFNDDRNRYFSDVDNECFYLNSCIGLVIRKYRREKNLSGEELGSMTGYSQQQVSRYERGGSIFSLFVMMKFADALNVTLWELLDEVRRHYLTSGLDYNKNERWG